MDAIRGCEVSLLWSDADLRGTATFVAWSPLRGERKGLSAR
ncbi:MAG: hypothetical protein ACI4A8_07150 [Muribaculaceae bacterium]